MLSKIAQKGVEGAFLRGSPVFSTDSHSPRCWGNNRSEQSCRLDALLPRRPLPKERVGLSWRKPSKKGLPGGASKSLLCATRKTPPGLKRHPLPLLGFLGTPPDPSGVPPPTLLTNKASKSSFLQPSWKFPSWASEMALQMLATLSQKSSFSWVSCLA